MPIPEKLHKVWNYLAVADSPEFADVIFAFGSQDEGVPRRAAELYHAGYAKKVLVTGGSVRLLWGGTKIQRPWFLAKR